MPGMPEPTLFTKIISGEIPCHKVYEDGHVFAFLDIAPLAPGHTLVVTKEPARTMGELSDDAAAALGRVLPRICRAVSGATGVEQSNVLQNNGPLAGQVVDHVHVHVIPKPDGSSGLGVSWPASDIDHEAGAALAADIAGRVRA